MYAHTPSPQNPNWQDLNAHLVGVAEVARRFAEPWGAGALAYAAGLWHDLGKFHAAFQSYLRAQQEGKPHRQVPHAIWGAVFVALLCQWKGAWKVLALPIAGHHTGLAAGSELEQKVREFLDAQPEAGRQLVGWAQQLPRPALSFPPTFPSNDPTRRELFIRMLFSALVDADYLDTEKHFDPSRTDLRTSGPALADLWARFQTNQQRLLASATGTQVNRVRRAVYESCLSAAENEPGIYRLTVPTGGGKTRSSLAFALKHALRHGLRRVVVAIPYTSIIEQTVNVYRGIFGVEAVLEHHSHIVPPENEAQDIAVVALRLAMENWDLPLIVTTTVELFESLFSDRPSRARKLHNLAQSVIVLDEVQTLPPGLLEPTLDVLRALVEDYGVTVVLCTATQPTFEAVPAFAGLAIRGELVPAYPEHFRALRRVRYEWQDEPLDWEDVAEALRRTPQVMVVLNTRRDALALLEACGDLSGLCHLSTLLCGAHRRAVLAEVRARLERGEPVRLITTQVVEAGVDLDFPVVWRAVGPLDRIVQAAGRCNREGRLPEPGRVVIFKPAAGGVPRGPYQVGLEEAPLLISRQGPEALHQPDIYRAYFRRLFDQVKLDAHGIQDRRRAFNYPAVAETYRLIAEDTVPVVVPYDDGLARLATWRAQPSRLAWRRLQPYVVSIYRREAQRLENDGWLERISEDLFLWKSCYDATVGVAARVYDPSDLIV